MADANTQQEPRAPDDSDTNTARQGKVRQENDVKEILATNIVKYRNKLGLSRAGLAKKIGVTEQAIGQYERGTRTPQIDVICKIADVLNVSVDTILERSASNYNAVREYRFDFVTTLFQWLELFVIEGDDGKIFIRQRIDPRPEFHQSDDGVIFSGVQEKFRTLAVFGNRESFVLWVEDLLCWVLHEDEMKNLIGAGLYYLNNEKPFVPNLRFKYLGNLEDEF